MARPFYSSKRDLVISNLIAGGMAVGILYGASWKAWVITVPVLLVIMVLWNIVALQDMTINQKVGSKA